MSAAGARFDLAKLDVLTREHFGKGPVLLEGALTEPLLSEQEVLDTFRAVRERARRLPRGAMEYDLAHTWYFHPDVAASVPWRSFCGIGSQDRVPNPRTLSGLTQKYGEETLKELYDLVSEDLRHWKIRRRRKMPGRAGRPGRSARRGGAVLDRVLVIVRKTMDHARGMAARIRTLRLRRKVQMTLDLHAGRDKG